MALRANKKIVHTVQHRLPGQVLENIRHQAILPEDNNGIPGAKSKIRDKPAVDNLQPSRAGEYLPRCADYRFILFIFAFVIRKIRPQVFNIESGLLPGVEAGDQFIQARGANNENNFILGDALHEGREK